MTLTICITAKNGIVMASDSRASSEITANDTVKKIFRLDDHTVVGIAGDGPLAIFFFDSIQRELNFRNGIHDVAEHLRALGKKRFDEYFSHQEPKLRPPLSIILAGYNERNEPEIYQLSSNDNFVPRKSPTGFACIGIPFLADYILNRLYDREITTDNASNLAAFCIKESASQHAGIGGPLQVGIFSNTKPYFLLTQNEIQEMEKKCENMRLLQKNQFYPEDASSGASESSEAKKA